MIEKKIHYIWVGGNPLNELAKKCIESWCKYCPDYEIIEWNESNLDISQNLHCKQAYDSKKYGFVVDFASLFLLYKYGGIYMDVDMELLKPLDNFLNLPAFIGFEDKELMGVGLIGAEKENKWIKQCLDMYENVSFIKPSGQLDFTTRPTYMTQVTKNMYPNFQQNNSEQHFEHFTIYPTEYFCPLPYKSNKIKLTENSHSIHHWAASWVPPWKRFIRKRILNLFNK